MIFYGHGVVWDPKGNKALCVFEKQIDENEFRKPGRFQTKDKKIIEKMLSLGYEGIAEEGEA